MEVVTFKNILNWLATYYSKSLSNDTIMAYYMKFKDIDESRFKKACNNIVDTYEFFPSVATLKKELENIPSDALQIERKKFYIGDWDNPIELPSSEEIDKDLQEVLRSIKNEKK